MSPSGRCQLRLLEGLRHELDFTVFATTFENPDPASIGWVRVPAVPRPLAARYVSYYAASTALHARARGRDGAFDLVQTVESYTRASDVGYIHFCHRAYLRKHWAEAETSGMRGFVRKLDHRLRTVEEASSLRRPRVLVVPSLGLRDELV